MRLVEEVANDDQKLFFFSVFAVLNFPTGV